MEKTGYPGTCMSPASGYAPGTQHEGAVISRLKTGWTGGTFKLSIFFSFKSFFSIYYDFHQSNLK